MESLSQPVPPFLPIMSPVLARRLPWAVVFSTLFAALVSAGIVIAFRRPDWWSGFIGASAVSGAGAIISIVILSRIAGRTVDTAVTYVMATAAVRMFLSLIGLIVVVKGFKTPPEPTGFMICGYYAATLVAETTLLARATRHGDTRRDDAGRSDTNGAAEKRRGNHDV